MALNFSHRPIFPANPSEDGLFSGMSRRFNWEVEDAYDWRRDRADRRGSREPMSNDILDILPSDPFGMDLSATFTAITGWIEELEVDSENLGRDEVEVNNGDYQFVTGLNYIRNRALRHRAEPGFSYQVDRFDGWLEENLLGDGSCDAGYVFVCNEEEFPSSSSDDSRVASHQTKESREGTEDCSAGGGEPHEALLFALSYLGVQDLLSVGRVCRSLHSTVQSDTLLWKNIHIDQPLNERITDDTVLQLTGMAQGNLQCLSLVECSRITDDGLRRVLDSNPRLRKLSVPGCTRLSVEGIVQNLKTFKFSGAPGIKNLRIGGLYGVTNKHYEELKLLLGAESCLQPKAYKPRFYHSGYMSLCCDDDRAIDIEMCPKCQNLRLVYDCPSEGCQGKQAATQLCRACALCIPRCVQCGRCINDMEYEETFSLDLLCSDCWKLLKGQERQEEKGVPP